MNRDELRNRAEEIAPKNYNNLIYPLDTQYNGTWIAADTINGNFACLLNYYKGTNANANTSRGNIVLNILNNPNKPLEPFIYKPFRLVSYINKRLKVTTFNGIKTTEETIEFKDNFFITSSSLDEEKVTEYRKQKFNKWLESNTYNNTGIPSIHFQQEKGNEEYSVLVSRPKTHTKSITQFTFENNKLIDHQYCSSTSLINL